MIKIGVKEARQHLTSFLDKVASGQEVVITRHNKPIAKLVPVSKRPGRRLGSRAKLRSIVSAKGRALSEIIIDDREERV